MTGYMLNRWCGVVPSIGGTSYPSRRDCRGCTQAVKLPRVFSKMKEVELCSKALIWSRQNEHSLLWKQRTAEEGREMGDVEIVTSKLLSLVGHETTHLKTVNIRMAMPLKIQEASPERVHPTLFLHDLFSRPYSLSW